MGNTAIIIGRSSGSNLVIKNERVSGRHCVIRKVSDTEYLVEDLNSTNGTFVNGQRIKQTLVKEKDDLMLADEKVDINIIIPVLTNEIPFDLPYEDLKKRVSIQNEFYKLKDIYSQYITNKKKVIIASQLKNTGIKAGLSLIPIVGSALGTLSSAVTGNSQEKLLEIEEEFKKEYICPSCFKFLGAEPFENLEKRKHCLFCRTKWIS